jgi:hypothetical protein
VDAYTQWVDGPAKINSISGVLNDPANEEPSVVEGSISTSAAKLVDL